MAGSSLTSQERTLRTALIVLAVLLALAMLANLLLPVISQEGRSYFERHYPWALIRP